MRLAHEIRETHRRWYELPGTGRHELRDVEHFAPRRSSLRHRVIAMNLALHVGRFLRDHPLGTVFVAPVDVELSEVEVTSPDLALVMASRRGVVTGESVCGVPDLVVEIVSEGSRRSTEVHRKLLYARFGVREYWVVEPEMETVRALRLGDGGSLDGPVLSREAGDRLTTPLLPGLEIPLAELFS
jgi:Uma2 family endonuclease